MSEHPAMDHEPPLPLAVEREQTDRSLTQERSKTDEELAIPPRLEEAAADATRTRQRESTDEQIRVDRKIADDARNERSPDPTAVVRAERERADKALVEERGRADDALGTERDRADRARRRESDARRETMRAFLENERVETDANLAHERRETDGVFTVQGDRLATAIEGASARDDFLGMVSHDMRSPLQTILATASSIARAAPKGDAGEALRHSVGMIRRAVARMRGLLDDLLDVASLEARRLSINKEPYLASQLLADAAEMLGPLATERTIELTTHLEGEDAATSCDPGRVSQVFSNLVGNSLKFMGAGGVIQVTARVRPRDVEFLVVDTGPGIASDRLDGLFERFSRGDTHGKHGSGLGLYITRGIVETHGGTISVTSEVGVGTRFAFTLPRA